MKNRFRRETNVGNLFDKLVDQYSESQGTKACGTKGEGNCMNLFRCITNGS